MPQLTNQMNQMNVGGNFPPPPPGNFVFGVGCRILSESLSRRVFQKSLIFPLSRRATRKLFPAQPDDATHATDVISVCGSRDATHATNVISAYGSTDATDAACSESRGI